MSCEKCSLRSFCAIAGKGKVVPSKDEYIVAVAGNPNVGKSTLFNLLTGGKQHVGNWPGKTVEKKEGFRAIDGFRVRFVDLPGAYSLSAYTMEELIARDFIISDKPDAVINIVDASTLERNLYLTLQVLELSRNVVVALNMMDLAEHKGLQVDAKKLSRILGVPVVPMVATKGKGLRELLDALKCILAGALEARPYRVDYGKEVDDYVSKLRPAVEQWIEQNKARYPADWLVLKLLEGDKEVLRTVERSKGGEALLKAVYEARRALEERLGTSPEAYFIKKRYEAIERIVAQVVEKKGKAPKLLSDKLDPIVLHPVFGLPIMLATFLTTFMLAFSINVGFPFNYLLSLAGFESYASLLEEYNLSSLIGEKIFGSLGAAVDAYLTEVHAPVWLKSFLVDGVINGVGGVLSFFPLIFIIFLFLGFLEDSGYMARAAVVMDKFMRKLNLTGRAFIPLLLGYGCNVPGVMASRAAEKERDRLMLAVLNPLIPCQARLAVMMVIVAAFLEDPLSQTLAIFSLYALSLALVMLVGLALNATIFKSEKEELVIELPEYHKPSPRVLLSYAWERSKHFLAKAGTLIFLVSIVMWFLQSFNVSGFTGDPNFSFAAAIGRSLSPLTGLIGLGDWRVVVALISGFMAKEAVVGTITQLMRTSDPVVAVRMLGLTPPQVYSLLVVELLYIPCLATLATIYKETGSWKWALFTLAYNLALAFSLAFVVYVLASSLA